jgi:hypothetical protein
MVPASNRGYTSKMIARILTSVNVVLLAAVDCIFFGLSIDLATKGQLSGLILLLPCTVLTPVVVRFAKRRGWRSRSRV